jgi:hypothetical protein
MHRVLSDSTHKVFRAGRVAIATYGFAFILGRNIAGHMGEFVRENIPDESSDDPEPGPVGLCTLLAEHFGPLLDQHFAAGFDQQPPPGSDILGFLVAGYEDGIGVILDVSLPSGGINRLADSTTGGFAWRGQGDVVNRLVHGCDGILLHQVVAAADEQHQESLAVLQPDLEQLAYDIPVQLMNLQDATDLAVLLIRTTIDVQRLTYGTRAVPGSWPGVGGPIDVAAVTSLSGYQWVQQATLRGERPAGSAELS